MLSLLTPLRPVKILLSAIPTVSLWVKLLVGLGMGRGTGVCPHPDGLLGDMGVAFRGSVGPKLFQRPASCPILAKAQRCGRPYRHREPQPGGTDNQKSHTTGLGRAQGAFKKRTVTSAAEPGDLWRAEDPTSSEALTSWALRSPVAGWGLQLRC